MSWKIQPQRSSSTALLHRGTCATYPDQVGLISREDAMVALAEPDIEPCEVCRPDTGLQPHRKRPAHLLCAGRRQAGTGPQLR
ncbi:DUF6233 domain-containing protein [Streptomyces sp. NPDC049944]